MKRLGKILMLSLAVLMTAALVVGCGGSGETPKSESAYRVLEEDLGAEEYGIAFRKDDVALGLEVQKTLDEMIADGTAAEISNKWFGEDILLKDQKFYGKSEASADDKSLEKVKQSGKLILGLDDSFPPMGFRDDNNNVVGFDIDLATEVAKRMGVELVIQPIDWNAKEVELSTGRIDCLWNGMSVNEERLEKMFIPKPYVANKQIVIVPNDSDIQTIADLKDRTVGLQQGSTSYNALEKNEVFSSIKEIVQLPENVTVFMELKAGRIEAFVVDEVVGKYIITNDAKDAE